MDNPPPPDPSTTKVESVNIPDSFDWLYNQVLTEISLTYEKGISFLQLQENLFTYTGYNLSSKPYTLPYLYTRLLQDNRIGIYHAGTKKLVTSITEINDTTVLIATIPLVKQVIGARDNDCTLIASSLTDIEIRLLQIIGSKRYSGITITELRKYIDLGIQQIHYQIVRLVHRGLIVKLFFYRSTRIWLTKFIPDSLSIHRTQRDLNLIENILQQIPGFTMSVHDIANLLEWDIPRLARTIENIQFLTNRTRLPTVFCALHSLQYETETDGTNSHNALAGTTSSSATDNDGNGENGDSKDDTIPDENTVTSGINTRVRLVAARVTPASIHTFPSSSASAADKASVSSSTVSTHSIKGQSLCFTLATPSLPQSIVEIHPSVVNNPLPVIDELALFRGADYAMYAMNQPHPLSSHALTANSFVTGPTSEYATKTLSTHPLNHQRAGGTVVPVPIETTLNGDYVPVPSFPPATLSIPRNHTDPLLTHPFGDTEELFSPFYTDLGIDYAKVYREGYYEGFTLEFGIDQLLYRLILRSGANGITTRLLREQFRFRSKRASTSLKLLQDAGLVTTRIIIMNKNNVVVTYGDADFATGTTGDLFLDDIPEAQQIDRTTEAVTKIRTEHTFGRSIFLKLLRNPFNFASATVVDEAAEAIRTSLSTDGNTTSLPFSNSVVLGAAALARLDNISVQFPGIVSGGTVRDTNDGMNEDGEEPLPTLPVEKSALFDAMQQLPVGFRNAIVSNSDTPLLVTTAEQRRNYVLEYIEKFPIITGMEIKRFIDGISYELVDCLKELRGYEGKNSDSLRAPDVDNKTIVRLIDTMTEAKLIQVKYYSIEEFVKETSVSLSKNGRIAVVYANDVSDTNPSIRAAAVDVCNYGNRVMRITKAMEEGRTYVRLLMEPVLAAARSAYENSERKSSSSTTVTTPGVPFRDTDDSVAMMVEDALVPNETLSGVPLSTVPARLDPSYNLLMGYGNPSSDGRTKNELYAVLPVADRSRSTNTKALTSEPKLVETLMNAPTITKLTIIEGNDATDTARLSGTLGIMAPRTMLMDLGTVVKHKPATLQSMTVDTVKSLHILSSVDNEDKDHPGNEDSLRKNRNDGRFPTTGTKTKRGTGRRTDFSDAENDGPVDNNDDEDTDNINTGARKRSTTKSRPVGNADDIGNDGLEGDTNGFDFDDDTKTPSGFRERTIRQAVIPPVTDEELIEKDTELRGCKVEDIMAPFVAGDEQRSTLTKTRLSFASKFVFETDATKRTRRRYDWTVKDEELLLTAFVTDRVDKEYALQSRYYRARLRYARSLHIYTHLSNFAKTYGTYGKGVSVSVKKEDENLEPLSEQDESRGKSGSSKKSVNKAKETPVPVGTETEESMVPINRPRRQIVAPQRFGDTIDNLSDIDLERSSSSSDTDAVMHGADESTAGPPIENFDLCVRCLLNVRQVHLVCCDKCPRSFCYACLGRTEPPEEDPWYCGECAKPIPRKIKTLNAEVLALPPLSLTDPQTAPTVDTTSTNPEGKKKLVMLNLSPVSSVKGYTGQSASSEATESTDHQRSTRRRSTTKPVSIVQDPVENLDICARCLQNVDQTPLACCDECPRSFCYPCLGRWDAPEEDPWYCGECTKPVPAKIREANTTFLQSLVPFANPDTVPETTGPSQPRGNKGAVLFALSPVSSVDTSVVPVVPPFELNPAEESLVNLDVCDRCLGTVYQFPLVCCDKCPRSFCYACLGCTEPPEEDPWYCGECDKPIPRTVLEANARLPPPLPPAAETDPIILSSTAPPNTTIVPVVTTTETVLTVSSSSSASVSKKVSSVYKGGKEKTGTVTYPVALRAPEYPGAGKSTVYLLKEDANQIGNGMWFGKKLVKPDPPILPKAGTRWNHVADALGVDEDTIIRYIRRLLAKKLTVVHNLAHRLDIARQQRGVRVYTRENTFFYQLNPTVLSGGRYLALPNEESGSDSEEKSGNEGGGENGGRSSTVKRPPSSTDPPSTNNAAARILPLDTRHTVSLFQHFTTRSGYALPPEVDTTLHPDTRTMWPGLDRLPSLIMTKVLLTFLSYAVAQNYYNALLTPDGVLDRSEKDIGAKVLRQSIHALRNLGETIDLVNLIENLKNRQLILRVNNYKIDKKFKSGVAKTGPSGVKNKTSNDQLLVDESDETENIVYFSVFGDDHGVAPSVNGRYELRSSFWNSFTSYFEGGFDKQVVNEMQRWSTTFFGSSDRTNAAMDQNDPLYVTLPDENRYEGGVFANILPVAIMDTGSLGIDLTEEEKGLNDRYLEMYRNSGTGKPNMLIRTGNDSLKVRATTKQGNTKLLVRNRLNELRGIDETNGTNNDNPTAPSSDAEELSSETDNGLEHNETGPSGQGTGGNANANDEKASGIGKLLEDLHELRRSLKSSSVTELSTTGSSTALVTPPVRKRGRVENIESDFDMQFRPLKRYIPQLTDSSITYQPLPSFSSNVWWSDHPIFGPGFEMILSHEVQLLKEIENRGIRGATVEDMLRFILSLHNTKDNMGVSLSQFYSLHALVRDMIVRAVLGKYCLPFELHYDCTDAQDSAGQPPLLFRAAVYSMDIYYYVGPSTKTTLSSSSSSSSNDTEEASDTMFSSRTSEMILTAVSLPPIVLTTTVPTDDQSPLRNLHRRTHLWSSFGKNDGINANMFNVITRTLVSIIFQNPGMHESVILRSMSMVSPSDVRVLLRFLVRIGILNRRMYLRQDIPKKTTLMSADLCTHQKDSNHNSNGMDTLPTTVLSSTNYDDNLHTIFNRSSPVSLYPATYNYLKAVGLQDLFTTTATTTTTLSSSSSSLTGTGTSTYLHTGLEKLADLWEKSSLFCITNTSKIPLTRIHHYFRNENERCSSLEIAHELELIPSDPLPIIGVLTEYYCEPWALQRFVQLFAIVQGTNHPTDHPSSYGNDEGEIGEEEGERADKEEEEDMGNESEAIIENTSSSNRMEEEEEDI